MTVEPSIGRGVVHLFYRLDRSRLDDAALAGKALAEVIGEFDEEPFQAIAFYPMSKTRTPGANWFMLPFEERKELMGGHARVGRKYAGRILQLITGSTGLDDYEWGVTLFADDPVAIKEIVYEMRFDEVSAAYADFGPFAVGLVLTPAELASRLGLA